MPINLLGNWLIGSERLKILVIEMSCYVSSEVCLAHHLTIVKPSSQSRRGFAVSALRQLHNVPFDNTTPIYLINLLWKLGLGFRLDSEFHYFSIFMENKESEHLIIRKFHRW